MTGASAGAGAVPYACVYVRYTYADPPSLRWEGGDRGSHPGLPRVVPNVSSSERHEARPVAVPTRRSALISRSFCESLPVAELTQVGLLLGIELLRAH